jgi:hypothetical protein
MASVIRAGRSLSRTSVLLHKRRLLTTFGLRLFAFGFKNRALKLKTPAFEAIKLN